MARGVDLGSAWMPDAWLRLRLPMFYEWWLMPLPTPVRTHTDAFADSWRGTVWGTSRPTHTKYSWGLPDGTLYRLVVIEVGGVNIACRLLFTENAVETVSSEYP